ncbi:MAG: hypothetical protein ACM3WT_03455 [Bacillota bacterium]
MVALDTGRGIGNRDLVDRVVGEVMRRLQPVVLCLFCGGTGSLETVAAQLGEMGGLPCRFRCVFTRAGALVLGTGFAGPLRPVSCVAEGADDGASPAQLVGECRIVVGPVMSQNTAVKAAVGIRDSLASEILACAFMMGKPVILVRDSIDVDVVPPGYRRTLLDHLATLESYGANVIPARDLSTVVKAVLEGQRAANARRPLRRLVDLRAAAAWVEGHVGPASFPLSRGTIITPLAADFLKEKRVSIVLEAPENAPCVSAPHTGAPCGNAGGGEGGDGSC